MSAINLTLDIALERESNELKRPNFWVSVSKLFKISIRFSFTNWLSNKLKNIIVKMTDLTAEINELAVDFSKEDAEMFYNRSKKSISTLIEMNEDLESIDYLKNAELKDAMRKCLDTFYILEARSKKIAKSGQIVATDSDLKKVLSQNSIKSLSLKLAK